MRRESASAPDILFSVERAAVPDAGEDSWCCALREDAVLIGVFDGSGGIGGRKYENYRGKTGAYVASRAVSGAVAAWFRAGGETPLRAYVDQALTVCRRYADPELGLKGSMRKDFPTTLAMMTAAAAGDEVCVRCWWAGDSRCYVLTEDGLHQITADDVNTADPMANLTEDGVLTNVVNASVPFEIHEKTLTPGKPCLLLSATDGCFGYLPSPMHFEHLLLDTLQRSDSIAAWKTAMDETLRGCAGDDYTLCAAGFGFSSFADLQGRFRDRAAALAARLAGRTRDELTALWGEYKNDYMWT